jgi:hypothetical protein
MTETIQNKPEQKSPFRKTLRKFSLIFIFSLIAVALIYYFVCGMTYSEGTRSGVLTKVSKKGYVFKTYEGELNVGGLNQGDGTIMPLSIFKFSMSDKSVYDKLEHEQGKKVVLHYKQVIHNFFWQGESDYFVHSISSVQ